MAYSGSVSRELKADRIARMHAEYEELKKLFPNPRPALNYATPLELLVATVLSAQTTDVRVNSVTKALFPAYPTARDYADAAVEDIEDIIHPLGFYRAKAKHLKGMGVALCENFGGEVPQTMEELVTLPGVGRKTANVVLGNAFGVPGFPVDTHVIRVTGRLRWHNEWRSPTPDPVRIERQVTANFPPAEWTDLSHRLIFFGRNICHARRPQCWACPLAPSCPSAPTFLKKYGMEVEQVFASIGNGAVLTAADMKSDDGTAATAGVGKSAEGAESTGIAGNEKSGEAASDIETADTSGNNESSAKNTAGNQ